jgi:hypothetical protein
LAITGYRVRWAKLDRAERIKVCGAIASALFIGAPAAFNSWWYMFSSTPPYQWFHQRGYPVLNFSALWITGPIGVVFLALILWSLRKKPETAKFDAGQAYDEDKARSSAQIESDWWRIHELNQDIARRTLQAALHRFKIACDPSIEGCVRRVSWGKDVWANFLRVKVESGSSASIENCTGFLTRIEKDGRTKWGGENAQLTFAHGKDPDTFAKTIRSKMSEFLDVLVVSSKNEIHPTTKDRHWRYQPLIREIFSEPGDYVLTVKITGDGVPTETALLKFTWTQNWQTAALTLISESSVQSAPKEQNPKVELQSEGGFIVARITNRSDSEVRVEHLWIVVVDVTGKKTLEKDRIREFKRCAKMPHVMPPHSSFEAIFSFSEGGFRSHALNPLAIAVKEYWIEVKLEDGTIIPSEHREIATPTNALANSKVDTSPKTIIELLDDLIVEGTAIEKFCGDMCDGEISKSKVEAWIATVRSTLRSSAPDYVVAFNDAVTNGGRERLYPPDRGSRTVIEMGEWAKDRVRQKSWQLVFACLVKLTEIRRAMRAKLPL